MQDAFAAACEKPPKPGGERAWLHRVTYNKCLDRLRRRRDVSLEALGDAAGGFTPEYDEGCAPAVIAALSRLKGEDRAIVLWRVYDELDYAEIARRLGIGEAAAASAMRGPRSSSRASCASMKARLIMAFDSDERLIRAALDAMESGLPVFDPVPGARARAGLRKRRRKLRMAVAAAAAAACLITGCAAALGAFDWLSDILPRSFVGVMEPVESTVSDEGIEFTVIGAQRFDGMAALYYSIRDVSGEGRISKNVSVPVSVRGEPRPEIMDNKLAYFDEASGAAVFELTLDEAEGCDELTVGAGVIGTRRVDIESSRVDAALDELLAGGRRGRGRRAHAPARGARRGGGGLCADRFRRGQGREGSRCSSYRMNGGSICSISGICLSFG